MTRVQSVCIYTPFNKCGSIKYSMEIWGVDLLTFKVVTLLDLDGFGREDKRCLATVPNR